MRILALGSLLAAPFISLFLPLNSYAAPFAPPPGYHRTPESFGGDVFAVAPDGNVAVGIQSDPTIRVYTNAAAAQANATPIRTFTVANANFWGDLTFQDNNTLLISEDSGVNGVLSGSMTVGTGTAGAVTFLGSVPAVQGVAAHNGSVYAVAVNGAGANAVYQVGNSTPILSGIGAGYLGGIAFDSAGDMLLTDSNDPSFSGNAGKLLRFSPALTPLSSVDLSAGAGSGAFDLTLDTEGDAFVSTNTTITEVSHTDGSAHQFGSAFSPSPTLGFTFITGLDFSGTDFTRAADTGRLWINAVDSEDSAIIGVQTPEPSGIALIAIVTCALARRRSRVMVAASLVAFAGFFAATEPTRADQFFATQVIATSPGGQQGLFTNSALALGGPRGAGTDAGSTDVYSLGNGGSITLGFDDANPASHRYIFDGPGPDLIVSENAFYSGGDPHSAFAELMFVEVSSDGVNYQRFPNYSTTPAPVPGAGTLDPDNLAGFAGVNPVLANVDTNSIDPFQVGAAGGDVFDLNSLSQTPLVLNGEVDLQHIRYLRLVDVIGDGGTLDSFARPIYDPTGMFINGADVDSVAVINGVHAPEPSMTLSLALFVMMRRSR